MPTWDSHTVGTGSQAQLSSRPRGSPHTKAGCWGRASRVLFQTNRLPRGGGGSQRAGRCGPEEPLYSRCMVALISTAKGGSSPSQWWMWNKLMWHRMIERPSG